MPAGGPRLEYILGHALAALLDRGLTILALPKLLSEDRFRNRVTAKIQDPVVRAFWREESAGYERRFRLEAIAPIQNKIGRLLANAPLRNIMGQPRSRFDAALLMDRGRIMIAYLAKGVIGEDHSRLLGALLLSQFQWAAMQRSGNPEVPRTGAHRAARRVEAEILSNQIRQRLQGAGGLPAGRRPRLPERDVDGAQSCGRL